VWVFVGENADCNCFTFISVSSSVFCAELKRASCVHGFYHVEQLIVEYKSALLLQ
jgi:hypothetical protein